MADTRIYRTQTAGNTTTWTFSAWVKRKATGVAQQIFNANTGSADPENTCYFDTADKLNWYNYISSVTLGHLQTTRKFRDAGAWMHIVCVWDTGNATPGDRMQFWINGVRQTALAIDANPAEDQIGQVNTSGSVMNIGANGYNTNYDFDGCMSWVQLVDGTALTATDFGSLDSTSGIWKIKPGAYATPGTNGFCLAMEDRSNLDLDTSSNAHTFTTSGTLTATYDTPSNNFATMNPLENYWNSATLSNGMTTVLTGSGAYAPVYSTLAVTSGKWYWEYKPTARGGGVAYRVGVASNMTNNAGWELGYLENDWAYKASNGDSGNNNTSTSYGDTWDTGDIIGLALDATNSKLYFSKNGVWQDSGDPTSGATGTGAISLTIAPVTAGQSFLGGWMAGISYYTSGTGTVSVNFGNGYFGTTAVTSAEADGDGIGAFEYAPPTGYFALCTRNIKAYGG